MTQPLLIGESPSKRGTPADLALSGTIGRRLARLLGLTVPAYEAAFQRVNLMPEFLGKRPGGVGAWPVVEAQQAALAMRVSGLLDGRPLVVFFGRRVAAAFGLAPDAEWLVPLVLPDTSLSVVLAPHPSGANRWWNERGNRAAAERFWQQVAQDLKLLEIVAELPVQKKGVVRRKSKRVAEGAPLEPDGGSTGRDLLRLPESVRAAFKPLKPLARRFVVCYCSTARGNAQLAARQAGVPNGTGNTITLASRVSQLMYDPYVRRAIDAWMEAYALSAVELTYQFKDLAEVNFGPFLERDEAGNLRVRSIDDDDWQAHKHWIKEIEASGKTGRVTRIVLHDALAARKELARILKLHTDQPIIALNLYLQTLSDADIVTRLTDIALTERERGLRPPGVPAAVRGAARTLQSGSATSETDATEDAELVDAQDGVISIDDEDI